MRILIDIGHPAHIHIFKNFAHEMINKNNTILFTCRDREYVTHLLRVYGFQFVNYGKHYKSVLGKIFGLLKNEMQLINTSLHFKPDMYVSHNSTIAAVASFMYRKPHIAVEDTFNMEQVKLSMPFTDVVLTGDYPHPSLGKKDLQYPGYHELAYLHPNVFTPSQDVFDYLGITKNEKYAIVRFVGWGASHDIGHLGISLSNKIKLVKELSRYIRVFVSSEAELPDVLAQYQIKIKAEQMHDALYFADLFVGESATMASESACLGTPAVYINNSQLGYILDLSKYGLIHSYTESIGDQQKAIEIAVNLVQDTDNKSNAAIDRKRMLQDKIDVTAFLEWFVENYPRSASVMKARSFSFAPFKQVSNQDTTAQ